MPRSALLQWSFHIHSETQVQDRVQEACSLETMVPLNKTRRPRKQPFYWAHWHPCYSQNCWRNIPMGESTHKNGRWRKPLDLGFCVETAHRVTWGTSDKQKKQQTNQQKLFSIQSNLFLACLPDGIDAHLQKLGELWQTFLHIVFFFFFNYV